MSILKDTIHFGRRRGRIRFNTVALLFGAMALFLVGEARGAAPTLTAVTVEHAGSEGAFTSVTMTDDGTGGDTTASDGVFGALVPVYEDDLPRYLFTYTLTLAAATEEEEEVDVGTTPTTLVINELMASNSTTILDPQGDDDDWIELKNTGTTAIDLGGMYLSDKTSNPLKWQFPAGTTIAAGGYLLIWADDDDGDSPGLHTNFKLSAGGESVVLSDIDARNNVVIDSVDFPAQTTDVSYGRSPEGSGAFQALATASPDGPPPTVPEIAIIADGPVTEGDTATFTVTAAPAPLADVVVNVSITQGTDDAYLPATLPTSVTITTGATEATLSVAIPDDSTDEPNGVLTVTVTSGTGYTVSATAGSASLTVRDDDANPAASAVVINELMAANDTTLLDPQGDADDWIELKNTSAADIDLSGMYLSDDRAEPRKWQFPTGTTIAAGGYLLIWADDDDGDSPGLHTNFKLSAGGESVVLSDTDANGNAVIDAVDFPALGADESYGRTPEGSGTFQALTTASPGDPTPLVPEITIIADGPVTEGDTATFTVTATPVPTVDVVVNVAVTQGASDNYLPATLPTSVTITAGATEATLSVAIPDDSTDEPNGVLTVTLEDGTGYTISATAGSASLTLRDDDANPAASAVVINELMAANDNTILDPQGDADDWIELKNTSEAVIDLSGMYLSDDRAEPRKWQFPTGTTIAAGGYLLIWADDDAGDSPGLHANFKLSAGGESVVLSDTDANGNAVIDAVDFPALGADESYGRTPEGTGGFQVLSAGSPGGPPPTPVASLTAEFVGMPAEHNGKRLFSFELRFSDDFPGRLPYTLLRDRAFRVTNGTVRQAKRVGTGPEPALADRRATGLVRGGDRHAAGDDRLWCGGGGLYRGRAAAVEQRVGDGAGSGAADGGVCRDAGGARRQQSFPLRVALQRRLPRPPPVHTAAGPGVPGDERDRPPSQARGAGPEPALADRRAAGLVRGGDRHAAGDDRLWRGGCGLHRGPGGPCRTVCRRRWPALPPGPSPLASSSLASSRIEPILPRPTLPPWPSSLVPPTSAGWSRTVPPGSRLAPR